MAQSGPRQSRSDQRLIHLAGGPGGFLADVDERGASDDGASGEAPEEEAVGAIVTRLRSGVGLRQRDRVGSWARHRVLKFEFLAEIDVVVLAVAHIDPFVSEPRPGRVTSVVAVLVARA